MRIIAKLDSFFSAASSSVCFIVAMMTNVGDGAKIHTSRDKNSNYMRGSIKCHIDYWPLPCDMDGGGW